MESIYFVFLVFCISIFVLPIQSLSCYKHGVCPSTNSCVIDTNKIECSSVQTYCFKADILLDIAERGCADSVTCNISSIISRLHCCSTDYCNSTIGLFAVSRLTMLTSLSMIVVIVLLFFSL